jgi:2-haloalkanoic acid dehalogenase type II
VTRAVLLDALGTLIRMEPPASRLRAELRRRAGVDVSEERAAEAFAAEIRYYVAHHVEGSDPAALDELRDRCAEQLRGALGIAGLDLPTAREAMLGALRFHAFPDAGPALGQLRARGLRLVVASNWDSSLPQVLERVGLAELLDGVVSSAMVGAIKPAPELFRAALELARHDPEAAVHVGDSPENDVAGARGAGIRAILLARVGREAAGADGVPVIRTLAELPGLILDE